MKIYNISACHFEWVISPFAFLIQGFTENK